MELIELLKLLAARKMFKGSCDICKEWQPGLVKTTV